MGLLASRLTSLLDRDVAKSLAAPAAEAHRPCTPEIQNAVPNGYDGDAGAPALTGVVDLPAVSADMVIYSCCYRLRCS